MGTKMAQGCRKDANARAALVRRQQVRDQIELRRMAQQLGINPKDIVKER
ncbi:MAG: hypothetical protein ACRCWL_05795 [Aeromonas sp.]